MKTSLRFVFIISILLNIILVFFLWKNRLKNEPAAPINKNKPFAGNKKGDQGKHAWKTNVLFDSLTIDSNDIVLMGDSFIAQFRLSEMLSDGNIKNRGIQGEFILGVNNMIPQVAAYQPRQIIALVGINDILHEEKHSTILKNYRQIIQKVVKISPGTKLSFISMLPMLSKSGFCINCNDEIREVNKQLKRLCAQENIEFIDLYKAFLNAKGTELSSKFVLDGLHINAEGYEHLKRLIVPHLATPNRTD